MTTEKPVASDPFWMDYSVTYGSEGSTQRDLSRWAVVFIGILRIAVHLVFLGEIFLAALIYPWVWIILVLYAAFITFIIVSISKGRQLRSRIQMIQERAKEMTGAESLGTALHTAGHPLLKVDQPVVLALKAGVLSVYAYASATPLDVIPVGRIASIATVVYDDDHIPHTAVADKTAQALQIAFLWREQECVAVFRMMRQVRPIDWYQAIQTARLMN